MKLMIVQRMQVWKRHSSVIGSTAALVGKCGLILIGGKINSQAKIFQPLQLITAWGDQIYNFEIPSDHVVQWLSYAPSINFYSYQLTHCGHTEFDCHNKNMTVICPESWPLRIPCMLNLQEEQQEPMQIWQGMTHRQTPAWPLHLGASPKTQYMTSQILPQYIYNTINSK